MMKSRLDDDVQKPVFLTKSQRQQAHDFQTDPASFKKPPFSHSGFDDRRHCLRHSSPITAAGRSNAHINTNFDGDQLDAIKAHYLGSIKPKKRSMKPFNRSRFSFSWENDDDTSCVDTERISCEVRPLFGRGFRGGIDRREQKKYADRHWSQKKHSEMTERDWRIFREDFNISYKGGGSRIPPPFRNWAESGLRRSLLKGIEKAGYERPTPIQMASIPLGLQQRDVIGISETGSGKTAAFILPMLTYISRLPLMNEETAAEGPYAVVLVPVRDLALQIEEEIVKLACYLEINVISILGGKSIQEQCFKLRQGCEIVVATPGRLLDCLESRYLVLNQCNYVVLDEADRMIDMGLESQVVGVLDAMPSSNLKPMNEEEKIDEKRIYRTTYMFTATMPPAVERLARQYLRNPVVVMAAKAAPPIAQHVIILKESEKMLHLRNILNDLGDKTAIVFVNTRKSADKVGLELEKAGYQVTVSHSGKMQEQRETNLEGFRTKRFMILVTTDVLGRGIDIPHVAHVINYDMPGDIQVYTHRIGRTGRAGNRGKATTFVTLDDKGVFYDLRLKLSESGCPVPPELARHEASKSKPGLILDRLQR